MAAVARSRALPLLDSLIVRSPGALMQLVPPATPVAALDVTSTHISLAQSDATRTTAAPLGVLARSSAPVTDARILASALSRAAVHDPGATAATALVVSVPPVAQTSDRDALVDYIRGLLAANDNLPASDDPRRLFPRLKAVLFYSEAHALARTLRLRHEFVQAVGIAPKRLESPLRNRYERAMHHIDPDTLVDGETVRARISVSEVLQVVLDELASLQTNPSHDPSRANT